MAGAGRNRTPRRCDPIRDGAYRAGTYVLRCAPFGCICAVQSHRKSHGRAHASMTPFFEPDPATVAEPLPTGQFRCRTCGTTWWPSLDGMLQPTLASWLCPAGCGRKPGVVSPPPLGFAVAPTDFSMYGSGKTFLAPPCPTPLPGFARAAAGKSFQKILFAGDLSHSAPLF